MVLGEIFLEEKTIDIDALGSFKGEDEVEGGEAANLAGEFDSFWKAEDGQLRQINFISASRILFCQNWPECVFCLAPDFVTPYVPFLYTKKPYGIGWLINLYPVGTLITSLLSPNRLFRSIGSISTSESGSNDSAYSFL